MAVRAWPCTCMGVAQACSDSRRCTCAVPTELALLKQVSEEEESKLQRETAEVHLPQLSGGARTEAAWLRPSATHLLAAVSWSLLWSSSVVVRVCEHLTAGTLTS